MPLKAATALGNSSGPVTPQVGPPPSKCGSSVAKPSLVLLKIHNDGGVTHALRLYGPELVRQGEEDAGRWLEAVLVTEPFAPELTGQRLEYRLLRLIPRQPGKREATFQFDVGQGTQDLGFRAEVPILFSVSKK